MSNHIIVERQQLEDLKITLLALRDFIQDLELCMNLLNIPFETSGKHRNVEFLEYLMDIATDQFPPDRCQDFKELTDRTRHILAELLK